jgi:hypothetical protein
LVDATALRRHEQLFFVGLTAKDRLPGAALSFQKLSDCDHGAPASFNSEASFFCFLRLTTMTFFLDSTACTYLACRRTDFGLSGACK